jgi:hypothetical protein
MRRVSESDCTPEGASEVSGSHLNLGIRHSRQRSDHRHLPVREDVRAIGTASLGDLVKEVIRQQTEQIT